MEWLLGLLASWVVTAVALIIVSKLPTGVEIASFGKALIAAAVFSGLNTLLWWILVILSLPLIILTLGLFFFVINAILFALAAKLVTGFRLRWGFWSALLGSIALSIVNSILFWLLSPILPI